MISHGAQVILAIGRRGDGRNTGWLVCRIKRASSLAAASSGGGQWTLRELPLPLAPILLILLGVWLLGKTIISVRC
jgi:hypothetical protein